MNGKEINLTGDNVIIKSSNFNVDKNGNLNCNSATLNNARIIDGNIELNSNGGQVIKVMKNNSTTNMAYITNNVVGVNNGDYHSELFSFGKTANLSLYGGGSSTEISNEGITTPTLTQTSLASKKRNIKKMENNALEIIEKIDIYKYNLKNEENTDKQHIGFIIGDEYNYSEEVTSIDNKGVDNYSFISLCCKAIQEQQKIIEEQGQKIKEMEEKINGSNS